MQGNCQISEGPEATAYDRIGSSMEDYNKRLVLFTALALRPIEYFDRFGSKRDSGCSCATIVSSVHDRAWQLFFVYLKIP